MVDLTLIFVEIFTRVGGLTIDREGRTVGIGQSRQLTRSVGNLKIAGRGAQCRAQSVFLVENILDVSEAVILLGVVVQRIRSSIRRLDAQVIAQKIARDEVIDGSEGPAVVDAGRYFAVAAAIQ